MTVLQVTGYLVWRAGLLIAAIGSLYWISDWLLAFWALPAMLRAGAALFVVGFVLLMASLVLERIQDEAES